MSIHPHFSEQSRRRYDTAALDIPVPDDLTAEKDRWEWNTYLEDVPLPKLLFKFAEALDQLHSAWRNFNPAKAGEAEKIRIFSKYEAAEIAAAGPIIKRLHFDTQGGIDRFGSDIGYALFFVTDLANTLSIANRLDWRDRAASHSALEQDEEFRNLIRDIRARYVDNQPPPPGYKDPGFA